MPTNTRSDAFSAVILEPDDPGAGAAWGFVVLPKDVSDRLPRRGRTTVEATINGHGFVATLEPDGQLSHWLRLNAKVLRGAAVQIGERVDIGIAPLPAEPAPTPPADFAKALAANRAAAAVWTSATPIAQVDWIHWIESGRLAKTRAERIAKACDMLASGKKRVCCFDPSGFYAKSLSAPKAAAR
ncbi:YdeI/OmpD-associated family protein [Chiayiivirga flava]|uniref:DUF1905 domain-containing protein n=1 Tax=Chiayiivirga flava TaxID=659595 RepID=A0A7W8DAP7_9GAMM|nr:YdeI/OmpD-associated family protein [Chiayiivirga flava]MBB5209656.1 hypothetical protein [Chiayiivirga flava]